MNTLPIKKIVVANVIAVLALLACCQSSFAQTDSAKVKSMEQRLFDLPDVQFEHSGGNAWILKVKQPIDHNNPELGHFYQQVMLLHRGYDENTVVNTNGYTLERSPTELVRLLDANYISVEHRYFGPSTPEGRDWEYLTIQQATADYHHIRELLGEIYDQKWISTGISKGGETCTYFKYFYPDDVDLCIPYVAPFPIGLKDQRFYEFLDNQGSDEVREKIWNFQNNVLKNKDQLVPRFKYYLKGKGGSVELLGGPEAALELIVLEYPFSFWQGGKDEKDIPANDADPEELLDHLIDSGDFWYLLDKSTRDLAAHYYQHATQFGYYGYRAERFGDLIEKWNGEPSACFFPYAKDLEFDGSLRAELTEWLKSDASDIVFIYGATDTWTVAQADTGDNQKVHKFILKDKHHGNARIRQADTDVRKEIIKLIESRLSDEKKVDETDDDAEADSKKTDSDAAKKTDEVSDGR